MKLLYSNADLIQVGHLHNILENAGIACWIKNRDLSGGIGGIPPVECWPQIWLKDECDYDRASAVIESYTMPGDNGAGDWVCACGEKLEGQFESCWNCGKSRET